MRKEIRQKVNDFIDWLGWLDDVDEKNEVIGYILSHLASPDALLTSSLPFPLPVSHTEEQTATLVDKSDEVVVEEGWEIKSRRGPLTFIKEADNG